MTDPDDVAGPLLSYLRRALDVPHLGFAETPVRLTGGFDTRIYRFRLSGAGGDLAAPLVLRLFRVDAGDEPARFEAAALRAATGTGVPVPRVWMVETEAAHLGAAFLVLDCVPGHVMLHDFFGLRLFSLPGLLARTQLRLHELDPEVFRSALRDAGCGLDSLAVEAEIEHYAAAVQGLGLSGLRAGVEWLSAHRPADVEPPVVCHGDFHPLNILVEGGRVTGVIDWALNHVRIGARAYDVAASTALMSLGPLDAPAAVQGIADRVRRHFAHRYVGAYAREHQLDPHSLRYYEALRCLGFLLEAGTHALARLGAIAPVSKPTAFGAARTQGRIIVRFRELTGVSVSLPGRA